MDSTLFTIGIIGNAISVLVFLSPIPTFRRIVRSRSTEEFEPAPYVLTLLNSLLWFYYGVTKPDGLLVATVNGFGAVMETIYVVLFLVYAADHSTRVKTAKFVATLDIGFFGFVFATTTFAIGELDLKIVIIGSICACLNVIMYGSPLAAALRNIRVKSTFGWTKMAPGTLVGRRRIRATAEGATPETPVQAKKIRPSTAAVLKRHLVQAGEAAEWTKKAGAGPMQPVLQANDAAPQCQKEAAHCEQAAAHGQPEAAQQNKAADQTNKSCARAKRRVVQAEEAAPEGHQDAAQGDQAVACGHLEAAQQKDAVAQHKQVPSHGELPGSQHKLPPFQGEGQGSQVEGQGSILQRLQALAEALCGGKYKTQNDNSSDDTISVDHQREDMTASGVVGSGGSRGRLLGSMTMRKERRIRIVIPPGKTRPTDPKVAAMFATACSLAVKEVVPILPHWKEYKGREEIFSAYTGHVSSKFLMDIDDVYVRTALIMNLKNRTRQRRHYLKSKIFDGLDDKTTVPQMPPDELQHMTEADWSRLFKTWSTPQKQISCKKAAESRKAVMFPSATGSRSYEVFCDMDEDAFELFKSTHRSRTRGFSSPVRKAISDMEEKMAPTSADGSGKEPLSAAEAVSAVLSQGYRNSSFLNNIGVVTSRTRATKSELKLQVDSQKKDMQDLRILLEDSKKKREQSDADMIMHQQGFVGMTQLHEGMKKNYEMCETLIAMLSEGRK